MIIFCSNCLFQCLSLARSGQGDNIGAWFAEDILLFINTIKALRHCLCFSCLLSYHKRRYINLWYCILSYLATIFSETRSTYTHTPNVSKPTITMPNCPSQWSSWQPWQGSMHTLEQLLTDIGYGNERHTHGRRNTNNDFFSFCLLRYLPSSTFERWPRRNMPVGVSFTVNYTGIFPAAKKKDTQPLYHDLSTLLFSFWTKTNSKSFQKHTHTHKTQCSSTPRIGMSNPRTSLSVFVPWW